MRIALIGGCGFVGINLAHALSDRGDEVILYDLQKPPHTVLESIITYIHGDVTDLDGLVAMLDQYKPDVVIHLASYGMSGAPMLSPLCNNINIGGCEALVEAMGQTGVECLIYTSTVNVIYGGEPIDGGDESLPYFDVNQHTDVYSASKAKAEQVVLAANGTLVNGTALRTMSLRPTAIYGDGEERHFPRIVKHIDSGIFAFRIGSASTVDWVHVENLVGAYMNAIDKIVETYNPRCAPCGHSYFISDGTPIDNFEFLRPLVEARGRAFPTIVLPVPLALFLGHCFEFLHKAVGIDPFLTRAEVLKVGRTHYFSIAKARRDLGYDPTITTPEGASFMAMSYARNHSSENYFRLAPLITWVGVNAAMGLFYLVAYYDVQTFAAPMSIPLSLVQQLGLAIFRSQANMRLGFTAAVAIHFVEACYSLRLTAMLGMSLLLQALWFIQSFFLGYGSLVYLLARCSRAK